MSTKVVIPPSPYVIIHIQSFYMKNPSDSHKYLSFSYRAPLAQAGRSTIIYIKLKMK